MSFQGHRETFDPVHVIKMLQSDINLSWQSATVTYKSDAKTHFQAALIHLLFYITLRDKVINDITSRSGSSNYLCN